MGHKVLVYIYDLSQGMARTMGPALIGRPLDGVWHTAVVVYGKEYFFGSTGIEFCSPGGTMLGQPLTIEDLGETEISEDIFQDYLRTQSQDRFRGDRYDLLRHNCNNFSHETAQFLVGKGIPQHILDLPNEVLATPLGQMLAPMLQQMTPNGNSITSNAVGGSGIQSPNSNNFNETAHSGGKSAAANAATNQSAPMSFPFNDYITFDQPLKVEGLSKKLDDFNSTQGDKEKQMTESELKIIIGIAKGLVRLSDENFSTMMKISQWNSDQIFPLLDILRSKCLKPSFDNQRQIEEVIRIFENNLTPNSQVNAMLAARGICNTLSNKKLQNVFSEFEKQEKAICTASALLPTDHTNLEISISSLVYNFSVLYTQHINLEGSVLLASSIATQILPNLKQEEAIYRSLMGLGNLIVTGPPEVKELLKSMDVGITIKEYEKISNKVSQCSKEILRLLHTKSNDNGLDLD